MKVKQRRAWISVAEAHGLGTASWRPSTGEPRSTLFHFIHGPQQEAYLALMADSCARLGVDVWAFCLMPPALSPPKGTIHARAAPRIGTVCEGAILVSRYMYARRLAPPPRSEGPGFESPSFVLWICFGFRASDFECGCGHRPQCELRHGRRAVSAAVPAPVGDNRACGPFLWYTLHRRRHTAGGDEDNNWVRLPRDSRRKRGRTERTRGVLCSAPNGQR